jgi:hypothetical protein
MCSLKYTSDNQKRLRYLNPTLVNQLSLSPQLNENSETYKAMSKKKWDATQKNSQKKKRDIASTNLGQIMMRFQDKDCILAPYNFK